MPTPEEKTVFRAALSKFGIKNQIIKANEEMHELGKEICKAAIGLPDYNHIAEEIADVQIMLDQLTLFFQLHNQVQHWRSKKVAGLARRITRNHE